MIVFLDQYGSMGGGQQVLLEVVSAFRRAGNEVCVLLPEGPCADKLCEQGCSVRPIRQCQLTQGRKGLADVVRLLLYTLAVFLKHGMLLRQAKCIYVNGNRLLPVALLASWLLNKNAVYHIHLNHEGVERRLFLWALRCPRTRALILPSDFIRRQLLAYSSQFGDSRVLVLENGVDARFAHVAFVDRFSDVPLRHFGIVGRISPEKGQDVLLKIAPRFSQLTFHVLGDAAFSSRDYEEHLHQHAPTNVVFHGWVDDVPTRVNEIGLQICLVPSRCAESSSLVTMQMTNLSCLVVVRRLGALVDTSAILELESFIEDDELEVLLGTLLTTGNGVHCRSARTSYERSVSRFGYTVYQQRLSEFVQTLTASISRA